MALVLCSSCNRHVRSASDACPFCGATVAPAEVEVSRGRLSRAAMVFGAMAVSVGAAACSKETVAQPYGAPPPPPMDGGPSAMAAIYGAPPVASASASVEPTAIAAPYGAPPRDPDPKPKPDAGTKKPAK